MSDLKPDDIPESVWEAAEQVGEDIYGRHKNGWVSWPLLTHKLIPAREIIARAIMAYSARRAASAGEGAEAFQSRVKLWMDACFGPEISADKVERNHRFLEEALELVQALGCSASEAHQLVDYVYGRPQGDINQEVGGVMVTLAALCLANGIDMHSGGETELARVWTKIGKIRAKQAGKPKHSPLPEAQPPATRAEVLEPTDAQVDAACSAWWDSAPSRMPGLKTVGDRMRFILRAALASQPTQSTEGEKM